MTPGGLPPGRIRVRVTRDVLVLVVSLIFLFGAMTLLATAWHIYQDARIDSDRLAEILLAHAPSHLFSLLKPYNRPSDPAIWVLKHGAVIIHSPNATALPAHLARAGLRWTPSLSLSQRFSSTGLQYVILWPLGADWVLFQWLALAIGFLIGLSGVAAFGIASWITKRVLHPVHRITTHVTTLLSAERLEPIPELIGEDELTKLATTFNQLLARLEAHRQQNLGVVADAAHHLRTPLAVIRGNLEPLRQWAGLDPEMRTECLDAIDRTLADMTSLTNDLLTLDEANSKVLPSMTPVDLKPLVHELWEDGQALLLMYGRGTLILSENTPNQTTVWAHQDYLRRAIWGVIDNAIRYGTLQGGEVRIELSPPDLDELCVVVKDSGPGIPPAELPKVTSRFYRGSNVRHLSGNGLGLSISQALMQAQHGSLKIESSDSGTCVTLCLKSIASL